MCPDIRIKREIKIEEREVPDCLKVEIYRVVQEALSNVAKHSKADCVHLGLRQADAMIELAIEDNGTGFDTEDALSAEISRRGFGLAIMRERTKLSGGSFSLKAVKGKGTAVRASWPSE